MAITELALYFLSVIVLAIAAYRMGYEAGVSKQALEDMSKRLDACFVSIGRIHEFLGELQNPSLEGVGGDGI